MSAAPSQPLQQAVPAASAEIKTATVQPNHATAVQEPDEAQETADRQALPGSPASPSDVAAAGVQVGSQQSGGAQKYDGLPFISLSGQKSAVVSQSRAEVSCAEGSHGQAAEEATGPCDHGEYSLHRPCRTLRGARQGLEYAMSACFGPCIGVKPTHCVIGMNSSVEGTLKDQSSMHTWHPLHHSNVSLRTGGRPGSAAAQAASCNTSIMTTSTMRRLGLDSPGPSIEQACLSPMKLLIFDGKVQARADERLRKARQAS